MGSLAVESLLGQLDVALLLVGFAVVFALLALAGCCHYGQMTESVQGMSEKMVECYSAAEFSEIQIGDGLATRKKPWHSVIDKGIDIHL